MVWVHSLGVNCDKFLLEGAIILTQRKDLPLSLRWARFLHFSTFSTAPS